MKLVFCVVIVVVVLVVICFMFSLLYVLRNYYIKIVLKTENKQKK